jgi:PAS domain-containing protein
MIAKENWPTNVITDARLLAGYQYWRRKAAGRGMPCRADIDPAEIPALLPHVRLVDVIGPGRYRYRLVGTAVQELHRVNPTGRFVHEALSGPIGERIVALYDECVRMGRALYFEAEFLDLDGSGLHRRSKVVFAPISADGRCVSQVLVFQTTLAADRFATRTVDAYAGAYAEIAHAVL